MLVKQFMKLHPTAQWGIFLSLAILLIVVLSNTTMMANAMSLLKSVPLIIYMPKLDNTPGKKP